MSSGLEVLFELSVVPIREVDIKYLTPKNDYYQVFFIKHKFLARKRNVSRS